MSREQHLAEVWACRGKAALVMSAIGATADQVRELINMVELTTGGLESPSDAGRMAAEHAKMLEEAVLNEPMRLAEVVSAEMLRYGNGF